MSSLLSRGRSTPAIRATLRASFCSGPILEARISCSEPILEARSLAPGLSLARSTLPLLVTGVRADDEDAPAPADHAALVADPLHRRTDLHRRLPYLYRYTTRPRV